MHSPEVSATEATAKELRAAAALVRRRRNRRARPKLPAAMAKFFRRAEPGFRRLGISIRTDGKAVNFGMIPLAKLGEFSARLAAFLKAT